MTFGHREVERKYDVPEDAPVPPLLHVTGVADVADPVQHELGAVYFDTADLALAAAGVTLRRRTGGDDAGWHLKRPLEDGDREEVRLPLGRAVRTVPKALLGQVRVHVRDRPVTPIATVSTQREVHRLLDGDGAVLAELCDDIVTASTPSGPRRQEPDGTSTWREWEVELVSGDRGLLDAVEDVVRRAGAERSGGPSKLARVLDGRLPTPAGEQRRPGRKGPATAVVQAHLREQVAELQARDPQVRRDEHDGVHKMRVATRRLRSALATFRPLLDREVTEPLRNELTWLAGVLGQARDAEVMRDRLAALLAAEPADLVVGPVTRRLRRDLQESYRSAHRQVLQTLDSDRYFRLLDGLDALVEELPTTGLAAQQAREVLPERVRREYKRLRRHVGAAEAAGTPAERDERLHDVRKSAKRARYAGEALVEVFGRPAEKFAKAAKGVQEVLGDHQDSVVARDLLVGIAEQAHRDGESTFTYGRLHALEATEAVDTEQRYAAAWRDASAKKLRRWLKAD